MKKRKKNNGVFYVVISLVAVLGIAGFINAYTSNSVEAPGLVAEGNITFNGDYINNEATQNIPEDLNFGASGSTHTYQQTFVDGFITGGSSLNASSTLKLARTITATEICNNSYIHVNSAAVDTVGSATLSAASLDLTFAATSTLFRCLKYDGMEKTITFRNNSPTSASSTELVAGNGCEIRLLEATGSDDTIEGQNEARITFRRTDDAYADGGTVDCIILVEETVVD